VLQLLGPTIHQELVSFFPILVSSPLLPWIIGLVCFNDQRREEKQT
jgi:hypothetical protein